MARQNKRNKRRRQAREKRVMETAPPVLRDWLERIPPDDRERETAIAVQNLSRIARHMKGPK